MKVSDHIKDLENTRAAKIARMEEITEKSMAGSRSFDESEVEEFDTIDSEINQLDEDLVRYHRMEKMQMGTAAPVTQNEPPVNKAHSNAPSRGAPAVHTRKEAEEKFEGQNFTRIAIAKAIAREEGASPVGIAEKRWGATNPQLVEVIKADVGGYGSGAGEVGSALVVQEAYTGDFIEYMYAQTIYNQLNLREVPANVTIGRQDGANTGYWVGESKAIPVSRADFNSINLLPLKVAALAVASKEWLRDSSWQAEMLVRDSLVAAASQRIDQTFLSAAAGVAGVSPAGILNAIAAINSAGIDGDGVARDLRALMTAFSNAQNASGELVIIMNPSLATGLQLMRNALDQYEFPMVSRNGGSVLGHTVLTGDNVPVNSLIMLKPTDIYRIGMESLQVSMTDSATIEMSDNPAMASDTPTGPTGKMVSMFQTESVAFKVVMPINFARRRESAVAWVNDADYGGPVST